MDVLVDRVQVRVGRRGTHSLEVEVALWEVEEERSTELVAYQQHHPPPSSHATTRREIDLEARQEHVSYMKVKSPVKFE